jgi:hypothetical protein
VTTVQSVSLITRRLSAQQVFGIRVPVSGSSICHKLCAIILQRMLIRVHCTIACMVHHRTGNLTLRELYKHLLQPQQFPTSAKYWKALAQLEIAESDTPTVEAVFEKCLPLVSSFA